jgi:hypothetical protein
MKTDEHPDAPQLDVAMGERSVIYTHIGERALYFDQNKKPIQDQLHSIFCLSGK